LSFRARLVGSLFFVSILVLSFQNCSRGYFRTISSEIPITSTSSGLSGNGGGYEGKPQGSYYHFIPGFTCEGKETFRDLIVVKDDSFLIYENKPNLCAKVPRQLAPDEIVSSPLQTDLITLNNVIFVRHESSLEKPPQALEEIFCRDDFLKPHYEIVARYNIAQGLTATRINYFETNVNLNASEDPATLRSTTNSVVSYSAFSGDLKFQVHLDKNIPGQSLQFSGEVTEVKGSIIGKVKATELTCLLGSSFEPRLKFTGNSDLATSVKLRIVNELMGAWNFNGECDVKLGNVMLQGEALDSPTSVACKSDGTFSQAIQFSGPTSPHFMFPKRSLFGFPQVVAKQGPHQAMTRIYAIPTKEQNIYSNTVSPTSILYVGTAAELQAISINDWALDRLRAIIITADIDLSSVRPTNNFTRLAMGGKYTTNPRFSSTLYGDGHQIKNLNMTSGSATNLNYVSLLGHVEGNLISDLHLRDANVVGTQDNTGILAGYIFDADVRRVSVTGSVKSSGYYTGGLFGHAWDTRIAQSWFSGAVDGYSGSGGLVGWLWDEYIIDSWSTGTIKSSTGTLVGGLVGWMYVGVRSGYIANTYSTANVTGTAALGGLIGQIDSYGDPSDHRDSFATGSVTNLTANPVGDQGVGPVIGNARENSVLPGPFIKLTNLYSLISSLCEGCSTPSFVYSSKSNWTELNNFTENKWDFINNWTAAKEKTSGPPTLRYNP
jgi:hypothetical protein